MYLVKELRPSGVVYYKDPTTGKTIISVTPDRSIWLLWYETLVIATLEYDQLDQEIKPLIVDADKRLDSIQD